MLCKGKALCMPHSVNGIDEGDFLCQHISIHLAALLNKHFWTTYIFGMYVSDRTTNALINLIIILSPKGKFQPDI